jgi:hypothetical protein
MCCRVLKRICSCSTGQMRPFGALGPRILEDARLATVQAAKRSNSRRLSSHHVDYESYRLGTAFSGAAVSEARHSRCCYDAGNTSRWVLCSNLRPHEALPHDDDAGPLSRAPVVVVQGHVTLRTVDLSTYDTLQANLTPGINHGASAVAWGFKMPVPDNDCNKRTPSPFMCWSKTLSDRSADSACRAISDFGKICDGIGIGMLMVMTWRTWKQCVSSRYPVARQTA